MPPYLLTSPARADLTTIIDFVANHNPAAAGALLGEFLHAFERVAQHPEIGHLRSDLTVHTVRFWPVRSYLVIYNSEAIPTEILRVLSGYRNLAKELEQS